MPRLAKWSLFSPLTGWPCARCVEKVTSSWLLVLLGVTIHLGKPQPSTDLHPPAEQAGGILGLSLQLEV